MDEYAPFKKVTKNEQKLMSKPWISNEILIKCKKRDAFLKLISKEKNLDNITTLRNEYKNLRNEITKDKRDGKKAHYISFFENNKRKSAELWKGIRNLVNIKPSKMQDIKLFDVNKNVVSDSKINATTFNNHFSTIGPSIERKIHFTPGSYKDYLNRKDSAGRHHINPLNSSFYLIPTVTEEIEKLIDNLNIKK